MTPSGDSLELLQIGSIQFPGGAEAAKLVIDPSKLVDVLSGMQAPPANVDQAQPLGPKASLAHKFHRFLRDPFGRIATYNAVRFTGGLVGAGGGANPFTIQNAAEDDIIETPPGATGVTLYFASKGSPTDGIQGYYSTSVRWNGNRNGKAYDKETNTYTGVPVPSALLISFDLAADAGAIHVASPVAGTPLYIGFTGAV